MKIIYLLFILLILTGCQTHTSTSRTYAYDSYSSEPNEHYQYASFEEIEWESAATATIDKPLVGNTQTLQT